MEGADWPPRLRQSAPTTLNQRHAAPWQSLAPLAASRVATKLYVIRAPIIGRRCGSAPPTKTLEFTRGRRLAAKGAPLSKELFPGKGDSSFSFLSSLLGIHVSNKVLNDWRWKQDLISLSPLHPLIIGVKIIEVPLNATFF